MEKNFKQIKAKILVVDDEVAICELIEAVLTGAGLEVRAINVSSEAAAVLATEKFDAAFFDVHMPAPNGIDLAQKMRASGFNMKTPIVMISGDGDPAILKKGFEAGANFFLFKPVDRRNILRLVRATQGSILNEKRRFHRVGITCPVTIECSGKRARGKTVDLSLGGALTETDAVFEIGAHVEADLQLAGGPPVHVRGAVKRSVGHRMGILFEQLGTAETGLLQEFLLPHIIAGMEQEAKLA